MAATPGAHLYSTEILHLAVTLADYPLEDGLAMRGEARSRSCGSGLAIGIDLTGDGRIAKVGLQAKACAVGQAAAALFARHASGCDIANIRSALAQIDAWLRNGAPLPDWPELAVLAPARDHPARHDAALLPWKAALAALSKPQASE